MTVEVVVLVVEMAIGIGQDPSIVVKSF